MRSKRVLATVAAAALGVGGMTVASQAIAAPADGVPAKAATAAPSAEDGRALFAGTFFLQGETGKALSKSPYFSDKDGDLEKNASAESRRAAAKLMDGIAEEKPGFFKAYSAKMRSGDPRQVEAGVEAGAKALGTAAKTDTVKNLGTNDGTCVINVAVAANAVTALNAVNVANVVNKVNFWVSPQDLETEGIAKDKAIADLTTRLAA